MIKTVEELVLEANSVHVLKAVTFVLTLNKLALLHHFKTFMVIGKKGICQGCDSVMFCQINA